MQRQGRKRSRYDSDEEASEEEAEAEEREQIAEDQPDDTLTCEEVSFLTVAELRAHLTDRGLNTKGKKAELVARLQEAIGEPISTDSPTDSSGSRSSSRSSSRSRNSHDSISGGSDNAGDDGSGVADGETSQEGEDTNMETGEEIDPASFTVAELRVELRSRGLDTKGVKQILVARLSQALGRN